MSSKRVHASKKFRTSQTLPPIKLNAENNMTQNPIGSSDYVKEASRLAPTPRQQTPEGSEQNSVSAAPPPENHTLASSSKLSAQLKNYNAVSSAPCPPAPPPAVPPPPVAPLPVPPPEVAFSHKLASGNQDSEAINGLPHSKADTSLMIPKPPPTPKNSPNASTKETGQQEVALPPLAVRLTEQYAWNWKVTDETLGRCKEELAFAIKELRNVKPVLVTQSANFSPLFILISQATTKKHDCSESSQLEIVKLLLEKDWVCFLNDYFAILFKVEDWSIKYVGVAIHNLLQGLQALRYPIMRMQPVIAEQIFDESYEMVFRHATHQVILALAAGPTVAPGFHLVRSLLGILQDFTLVPSVCDSKITAEQVESLKALMTKYTETLIAPYDMATCYRALNFLEKDESPLVRLPLQRLVAQVTSKDPDEHANDIEYVRDRLTSVSVQTHLRLPWRYQAEFNFVMTAIKPGSTTAGPKHDVNRYYQLLIANGKWHKLITDLHSAALVRVVEKGEDDPVVNCVLTNVLYAFSGVTNGTDICRDRLLQQKTFQHFFEYIFQHLSESSNLDGVVGMIKVAMITILHNFSYFYEPSIPIMRDRGTLTLARDLRLQAQDSSTRTDCLLIIAFLMNESDSKKLMKITDDELSYLVNELEKSMLNVEASDYHPEEIIDGLNRIAVSDINKLKLIECDVLKLLSKSLNPVKPHTTTHRAAAAKAVWNLAFSEESREEIKAQKGLMSALKSFKDSENKELRLAVSGALWQLEGKEKHLEDISVDNGKEPDQKHIMLSYNHQAKAEVSKMKDLLKQQGYKVWIDYEQITAGGSTLEAMSTAIEGSCLVLIFFSEPYKNSINCRAEAEYVFERRKQFIPVQVQAGYTPEGWLGILFGSKFRYTLCKPDKYKTEVEGLLGKVKELVTGQIRSAAAKDVPDTVLRAATALPVATKLQNPLRDPLPWECESWSCQETREWLEDNELGPIKDSLEGADGAMLAELGMLSYHHKDVFYTLMCSKTGADLCCMLRFSKALKKLAKH